MKSYKKKETKLMFGEPITERNRLKKDDRILKDPTPLPDCGVPEHWCKVCEMFHPLSEFSTKGTKKNGDLIYMDICREADAARKREETERRAKDIDWSTDKKLRNEELRKYHLQNPNYRLLINLRSRSRSVFAKITVNKISTTLDLIGCNIDFLRKHIQKQFLRGMTWENYGTVWHIDHIEPLSMLMEDASPEMQRRLMHYNNLRPLWVEDNLSKNDWRPLEDKTINSIFE